MALLNTFDATSYYFTKKCNPLCVYLKEWYGEKIKGGTWTKKIIQTSNDYIAGNGSF